MPRPRKVTPTRKLSFYVSEPVATRLELMLWSPLEGKVPFGAYGEFFEKLLQDYFRRYDAEAGRQEALERMAENARELGLDY